MQVNLNPTTVNQRLLFGNFTAIVTVQLLFLLYNRRAKMKLEKITYCFQIKYFDYNVIHFFVTYLLISVAC